MSAKPDRMIVADENIVAAAEVFSEFGRMITLPAARIVPETLNDAEILLVRSVTTVNRALLDRSKVRFVGSATIGTDHIDRSYLRRQGIRFADAPGSNAGSVVEYVIAALLYLERRDLRPLKGRTTGIVGCGNIGGKLAERLPRLGFEVLCNDPPLARKAEAEGRAHSYVSLDELLERSDILSLHVPLTESGINSTRHLLNRERLQQIKPGCTVVNTSRGPVIDSRSFLESLQTGKVGAAVLDVWENEPAPSPDLIRRAAIATPHIAGYSYDGKLAGTLMLRDALARFLGQPVGRPAVPGTDDQQDPVLAVSPEADDLATLHALVRQVYPIEEDDARLREAAEWSAERRARVFVQLRRTYPRRYAFERYRVAGAPPALAGPIEEGLKMRIAPESHYSP